MTTAEMRELPAELLQQLRSTKVQAFQTRQASVEEKKKIAREAQDVVNQENRFITRDAGAIRRLDAVLAEKGVEVEAIELPEVKVRAKKDGDETVTPAEPEQVTA